MQLEYLTDEQGNKKAVIVPIDIWEDIFPEEIVNLEDLTEKLENYCLNKAMDEAKNTPLLDKDAALQYLDE